MCCIEEGEFPISHGLGNSTMRYDGYGVELDAQRISSILSGWLLYINSMLPSVLGGMTATFPSKSHRPATSENCDSGSPAILLLAGRFVLSFRHLPSWSKSFGTAKLHVPLPPLLMSPQILYCILIISFIPSWK